MAIYDFQGPSNLSALLGQGVGQGLGAGLEDILKNKMGQYQQQQELAHQQKQMAQLGEQYKALGLNPAMAYAPPQVQQEMMKQQQRSQLATLLSGGQQMPQEQQGLQQLMPQQAAQQPVQQAASVKTEKNFEAERQKIAPLAAYSPDLFQREKARIDRAEAAYLKRGQEQTKTLMPIVSEANQNIRASENKIKDLGLLKHMIEQGKWQTNKFQDIAEKFGLGTIGLSPDSELARQVGAGLALQDVKLMKGSLSDREGAWLRSMYPSLMQTAEGAKKLANKLISDQKAEKLIEEEKLKLIKKNRNIDPLSIETEAFANTQKQRDTIARDMLKDLGYLVQWKDDETGKTIYLPIGETPKD